MAKKLTWAFAQKSWSLVLRAAVFAVVWFVAPWWLSSIAAILFYIFPFLQTGKLLVPFVVLLSVSALLPQDLWGALYVGVAFWALLGIKELWVIDRRRGMTTLALLLMFPLILAFFDKFHSWQQGGLWWALFAIAVGFVALAFTTFRQYRERHFPRRRALLLAFIAGVLFWQMGLVTVFLPLDPYLQVALLFSWTATFLVAGSEYMLAPANPRRALAGAGGLTRRKMFAYGAFVGLVTILILATLP